MVFVCLILHALDLPVSVLASRLLIWFFWAASGELYVLQPQSASWSRWQTQPKPWVPRSAFVLELLHKIENILDDRNLFQSHCAKTGDDDVRPALVTPRSAASMTPRASETLLDRAGFLRLLRSADIVGESGGMVDEQFAMNLFLRYYMKAGHKGMGTQPRISFDAYQLCLFHIGSHAADMDNKSLIPDKNFLEVISPDSSPVPESDTRAARFDVAEIQLSAPAGWSSPRKLNETRARTASGPCSRLAVPGPGMYVQHLFTPFPNKSIFPGGNRSAGGVRGWTWGTAQQRNFMKDTLQEIGLSPGPAAYGDNNLGMNRAQLAYGKGQLPGGATHAQFGTAERQVSVSHKTVAGMKGGVTCELLNGVPQVRKPMLRKGDRKFSFSDVRDVVPTKQQLKEARHFLEYMFQQERLREKEPPSNLIRTVSFVLSQQCIFATCAPTRRSGMSSRSKNFI